MHLLKKHQPKKPLLKKRLKLNKDHILIGKIMGAHGVKGLVRLEVYVDDLDLFEHTIDYSITLKNRHKSQIWLANIDGINNKEEADTLKGTQVSCPISARPALDDDEFYFSDLIGMDCIDHTGKTIGTVIATENFGAGDLLEVKPMDGTSFYLAYTPETVSFDNDKLVISVPEMI